MTTERNLNEDKASSAQNAFSWIKWTALLIFSIAILVGVVLASLGKLEMQVNLKDWNCTLKPGVSFPITDPSIKEMIIKRLSNDKLINSSRTVTYSIKEVNANYILYDMKNDFDVKNTSEKSITEELEIRQTLGLNIIVTMDKSVINPIKVKSVSPTEEICTYPITVLPGQTKKVEYTKSDIKEHLPIERADTLTRPTLHSTLFFEGRKDLMDQLSVEAIGLTWRDNWEQFSPAHPEKIIYGWRSISSMFPHQGAYITIKENDTKQGN